MIVAPMEVEVGFRKADVHNIPLLSNETVFNFAAAVNAAGGKASFSTTDNVEHLVDYVQIRRTSDACEVNALVFPVTDFSNTETHSNVAIKVDEKQHEIEDCHCSLCVDSICCTHIIAFIFWLHRKSCEPITTGACDFWGHEFEALADDNCDKAYRVCDLLSSSETCAKTETTISNVEGQMFLDAVIESLDHLGARDAPLYRQCVETIDEFDAIFVHHTLLNSAENNVTDADSFIQYMIHQAALGLFDSLNEVTKNSYKSTLWLEAQYMRIRCSLMHRIASRKSSEDDKQIIDSLFCKDRNHGMEERQQLKQHKRFILKQTEKLENKTYYQCGLLLHESHPYIVAAPDGITDDHIVEIKVPKTDEEFENYLEGRETIAPKYMAQIQVQMYMANVPKALYCVLSPTFETNGALHYVWVQADNEFVTGLLSMAEEFWKEVVYPRLMDIY